MSDPNNPNTTPGAENQPPPSWYVGTSDEKGRYASDGIHNSQDNTQELNSPDPNPDPVVETSDTSSNEWRIPQPNKFTHPILHNRWRRVGALLSDENNSITLMEAMKQAGFRETNNISLYGDCREAAGYRRGIQDGESELGFIDRVRLKRTGEIAAAVEAETQAKDIRAGGGQVPKTLEDAIKKGSGLLGTLGVIAATRETAATLFKGFFDKDKSGNVSVGETFWGIGKFAGIVVASSILLSGGCAGFVFGRWTAPDEKLVEVPVADTDVLQSLTTPVRTSGFIVLPKGTPYTPFPNSEGGTSLPLELTYGVNGAIVPEDTVKGLSISGTPLTESSEKIAVGMLGGQRVAFPIPKEVPIVAPQVNTWCPDGGQIITELDVTGNPVREKTGILRELSAEDVNRLKLNTSALPEQETC